MFTNLPIDYRSEDMGSASIPPPSILIIILIVVIHSAPAISALDNRTAYEVLQDYNFPVGILPEGVQGYDLDIITGEFSVYLGYSCSFSLNGYRLNYKPTIKGYILNGKIFGLKGVSEKLLLVWIEIDEIVRNGNDLIISIGVLSYKFPVNDFEQSPQCGVGRAGKLRTSPFLSLRQGS